MYKSFRAILFVIAKKKLETAQISSRGEKKVWLYNETVYNGENEQIRMSSQY